MSKSKLILFELKQILCLWSLSQDGNNIQPITLAGNAEINADAFFSPISSYLAYSSILSHLFVSTVTLPPTHTAQLPSSTLLRAIHVTLAFSTLIQAGTTKHSRDKR